MAKILVADDEADLESLIKQRFRKQIRENKYQFVFAMNGKQAMELLQQSDDVDIVLSDINMPGMDGLTLLSRLSEELPLIKTVIVSAYGDMDNIRTAMNRGAFDFVCKPVNFDDLEVTIDKTIHHVDQLKQTLQAIRENNILKMYVDESVLSFMNSKEYETTLLQNETIEASVVFIDICGFTSISEKQPADVVVALLNNYFDVMVHEILMQDGHVDKFIGDAVMAVFKGDYHIDRAVEVALSIRKKIEELPNQLDDSFFQPKVSIGINSGEVISGNIGSASLKRLDYTIIGDVVNTAQRLQSAAKAGQILINEACYQKIKDSFDCKFLDTVNLKHKEQLERVYQVLN